jgi:hypothetical protein
MTSTAPVRRHRIESCERITPAHLRPRLAPGATKATPPGGGVVALLWRPCRRTYGDRGLALLMLCPRCSSPRRVLWRPPGEAWACSACHPLIWPSQRRSGSRSGNGKPRTYELDRIVSAQRLCADRLGVAWPPERIIWSAWDLPRLPKASRLSAHRQWMLRLRLEALENLRVASFLPQLRALSAARGIELPPWEGFEGSAIRAEEVERITRWAVRRPARDPRSLQSRTTDRNPPWSTGRKHPGPAGRVSVTAATDGTEADFAAVLG